jgi:hypothetical protein
VINNSLPEATVITAGPGAPEKTEKSCLRRSRLVVGCCFLVGVVALLNWAVRYGLFRNLQMLIGFFRFGFYAPRVMHVCVYIYRNTPSLEMPMFSPRFKSEAEPHGVLKFTCPPPQKSNEGPLCHSPYQAQLGGPLQRCDLTAQMRSNEALAGGQGRIVGNVGTICHLFPAIVSSTTNTVEPTHRYPPAQCPAIIPFTAPKTVLRPE